MWACPIYCIYLYGMKVLGGQHCGSGGGSTLRKGVGWVGGWASSGGRRGSRGRVEKAAQQRAREQICWRQPTQAALPVGAEGASGRKGCDAEHQTRWGGISHSSPTIRARKSTGQAPHCQRVELIGCLGEVLCKVAGREAGLGGQHARQLAHRRQPLRLLFLAAEARLQAGRQERAAACHI